MSIKISANIKDLIPEIVEVSSSVSSSNLLDKTVVFEDKGVYNKVINVVTYYAAKTSDKNCCRKYNEFSSLVPELNNLLSKYRIAIMTVSFGENNPFAQPPYILDRI